MDRLQRKNEFDGSLLFGSRQFYDQTDRTSKIINKAEDARIFKIYGDTSTGLIGNNFTSFRSCICGSGDAILAFVKFGFQFWICKKCDFLYVNPILRDSVLDDYYRNEDSWTEVLQNPLQVRMDKLKFCYGLDIIEKYTSIGRVLDVGCGPGHFLEIANTRGWQCSGIELNTRELEVTKKKGITATDKYLTDTYYDNETFDVITLWEVLEHVAEPTSLLKRAYSLLRDGGNLFILVPNRDSLINRMLREKSNSLTGYCHINFFNANILSDVLVDEGFVVLEKETIISELSNIKNYLSYSDPYHGDSSEEIPFLTPDFIHRNLLGCKLLILARKS